jgi:hypothetical protein
MRHLYGVVLAVLLAAAVFFGAAWGYMWVTRAISVSVALSSGSPAADGLPAGGGSLFPDGHVMLGGGAMLAVGLAAGLLMAIPRVSPLAAGLPGLVLVAWTALYYVDVRDAVMLIPLRSRDFGAGFESLLFTGLLGMAGLALIVPLFIPSRWRRPSRIPGNAVFGASTRAQPVTVSPGTTLTGSTTPPSGDSNVLPKRTRPQQNQVTPPDGFQAIQAPEAPPDQG